MVLFTKSWEISWNWCCSLGPIVPEQKTVVHLMQCINVFMDGTLARSEQKSVSLS